MKILLLGFFASHNGSNMQSIIDACKEKKLNAVPSVVISNNSKSIALQRAKIEGIPYYHISNKTHPNEEELDSVILEKLKEHNVDIVILAGYMKKIGKKTLNFYHNKILNIHPALLPKFGGKGMYGRHVHEAVLAAGEKKTGVTIHIVDNNYDTGPIVAQTEVSVLKNDNTDSLSKRVLKREHEFFIETLQNISEGSIDLNRLE